jgi:hypothetical protein
MEKKPCLRGKAKKLCRMVLDPACTNIERQTFAIELLAEIAERAEYEKEHGHHH